LVSLIKRAKQKYDFHLTQLSILDNHSHFMLQPFKGANISKIMQWIQSMFARAYNKYHGIKGHVFYDRFVCKVVKSYRQFVNTFNYILNNPVKAGIAKYASEYAYNGINLMNKGSPYLLDPPEL
jgi:REP element-mobilizing transposase RayT